MKPHFWPISALAIGAIGSIAIVFLATFPPRTSPAPDARQSTAKHEASRPRQIVFLGSSAAIKVAFEGFKEKLEQLAKGSEFNFEYLSLDIPPTKTNMQNAVEYISGIKPALVVTGQTQVPYLAEKVTKIPVVVVLANEAVQSGYAKSEAGSGNNFVFVERRAYQNAAQGLEFFLELAPWAKNILVLRGDDMPDPAHIGMSAINAVAARHGLSLTDNVFSSRSDLNKFFLEYDFSKTDAMLRYPSALVAANIDLFFVFQDRIKKPVLVPNRPELELGGILAYGARNKELGETGAAAAWQIFKGQIEPATTPILHPFRFELGINERVAKTLGIPIPPSLRKKADYIIR